MHEVQKPRSQRWSRFKQIMKKAAVLATAALGTFFSAPKEERFIKPFRLKEVMAEPLTKNVKEMVGEAATIFQSFASTGSKTELEKFRALTLEHMKNDEFREPFLKKVAASALAALKDYILSGRNERLEALKRYAKEFGEDKVFREAFDKAGADLKNDPGISRLLSLMQVHSDNMRKLEGKPPEPVTIRDLMAAANRAYIYFQKGDYSAGDVEKQWGKGFVSELFRRSKLITPIRVETAKPSPELAFETFRAYVVDVNYNAWARFSYVWENLNAKQKSEFQAMLEKDPIISGFLGPYQKMAGDPKLLAHALKDCYERLNRHVPGLKEKKKEVLEGKKRSMEAEKNSLARKYGPAFVNSVYSNLGKLGWLSGKESDIARELRAREDELVVQDIRGIWTAGMMSPDRILGTLGEIRKSLDDWSTQKEVLGSHRAMAFKLAYVYSELKKGADKKRLAEKYGKDILNLVSFLEKRKEAIAKSGLLSGSLEKVAKRLEKPSKGDEALARDLRYYVGEGEELKDFAEKLLDVWSEASKPAADRKGLDKTYGPVFVKLIEENMEELGFVAMPSPIKTIIEQLEKRKDNKVIQSLLAAWRGAIASNRELYWELAHDFKKGVSEVTLARRRQLVERYSADMVIFCERMESRRNDAVFIAQSALPILVRGVATEESEKAALDELDKFNRKYSGDPGFSKLVLTIMDPVMRKGFEAWQVGNRGGSFSDFAKHALEMKGILHQNIRKVYTAGLSSERLSDLNLLIRKSVKDMKGKGSPEWVAFVDGMEKYIRAQYQVSGPDRFRLLQRYGKDGDQLFDYMGKNKDALAKTRLLSGSPERVLEQLEEGKKKDNKFAVEILARIPEGQDRKEFAAMCADVWYEVSKQRVVPIEAAVDAAKLQDAKALLQIRQKAKIDRMILEDMLSDMDYVHTMTEGWANYLYLHLAGIESNFANASMTLREEYRSSFRTLDPMDLGRRISEVHSALSERQGAVKEMERRYRREMVAFVSSNSREIHRMFGDSRVAEEKKEKYDWMEQGEDIGLRNLHATFYGEMTEKQFIEALQMVHKRLYGFEKTKGELGEKYGRSFVDIVDRNFDSLRKVVASPPKTKDRADEIAAEIPAFKRLMELTSIDEAEVTRLKKRVETIRNLHLQFFNSIVTGAELERQLEQKGLGPDSLKDEGNRKLFSLVVAQVSDLTADKIESLRSARATIERLPFEWQKRVLERFIPEVREAANSEAVLRAYDNWMERLKKTITDENFTEFQKFVIGDIGQRPVITLAPDRRNLPGAIADSLAVKVSGADVVKQFMRLQPETRYQLFRIINGIEGMSAKSFLESSDGLGRFSALCSSLTAVDQFYAPLLLELAGKTILKYQPYEIQIMVGAIAASTQMFANANAYHLMYSYYRTLPAKIDRMFTTVEDIYRKTVVQPGVLVTQPSDQDPYRTFTNNFGLHVNLMKTIYTQLLATPGGAGQNLIVETPAEVGLAPPPGPYHDYLKQKFFGRGLIRARINRPLPMLTAPLALSQLYRLMPDRYPNVGKLRNLYYNIQRSMTYATGERDPTTNQLKDTTTGRWRDEVRLWGYGKELSATAEGTFNHPKWLAYNTTVPGGLLGLAAISEPSTLLPAGPLAVAADSLAAVHDQVTLDRVSSRGRNLSSIKWIQEAGGVTNFDFTLTKNAVSNDLEDVQLHLRTTAPGGTDTIIDVVRAPTLAGDFEYNMHIYKRFGNFYLDNLVTPLSKQEGELYFQRAYQASAPKTETTPAVKAPVVFKTEAGYRDLGRLGRGPAGTEHGVIFADSGVKTDTLPAGSTEYQGAGFWTPIGMKWGALGAYEMTREGRVLFGIPYLNPESRILGAGRFYFLGTEDPTRTRALGQFTYLAPSGRAGRTPWTLDAFIGAGKLRTAVMNPDGTPKLEAGSQVFDTKWVPMAGAAAQAIHNSWYWRLGGLYTPEFYGGSGFVGSKEQIWTAVASASRRKLEEIYIRDALFGEYKPGDAGYVKPNLTLLTGDIIDASAALQLLFGVKSKLVMGGAGYIYQPTTKIPEAVIAGQTMMDPRTISQINQRGAEEIYRRSVVAPEEFIPAPFKYSNPVPRSVLYELSTAPTTTTAEKQWALGAITEYTLFPNGRLAPNSATFRALYLGTKLSAEQQADELRKSGWLAGTHMEWKPFSIEAYGEATERNQKMEWGTAVETMLIRKPTLTITLGAVKSPISETIFGGWAGLLTGSKDGRWEFMGIGTANRGYRLLTGEAALGLKLRMAPALEGLVLGTGIWQRDLEKNLDSFKVDVHGGTRFISIPKNLAFHLYGGYEYWRAKRREEAMAFDYTISQGRAFLRSILELYSGEKIMGSNMQLGLELYGGQRRGTYEGGLYTPLSQWETTVLGTVTVIFGR